MNIRAIIGVKTVVSCDEDIPIYLDVVDMPPSRSLPPHITVITITDTAKRFVQNLVPHKVITIPQQHCNFDNEVRPERPVKVVGYCGDLQNFQLDIHAFANQLAKNNLRLDVLVVNNDTTREEVVDFHKRIDIAIDFRQDFPKESPAEMRNPLKVLNAGSFGIPTIAYPFITLKNEVKNFFPIYTINDAVTTCCRLRDNPKLYKEIGQKNIEQAKLYHIDRIIDDYYVPINKLK
jgi:hypothetical protein